MAIPLAHFLSRCKGFFTMWRGCGPTVSRAIVLNAAQLGTYDQAKQMLLQTGIDSTISCFFYLYLRLVSVSILVSRSCFSSRL